MMIYSIINIKLPNEKPMLMPTILLNKKSKSNMKPKR